MKSKLKIGHAVLITRGKFSGKVGTILDLQHKNNTIRVKVSGVNVGIRTIQPTATEKGEWIEAERWINISFINQRWRTGDYAGYIIWLFSIKDRNKAMEAFVRLTGSLEAFKNAEATLQKGQAYPVANIYKEDWAYIAVDKTIADFRILRKREKPSGVTPPKGKR